jgi:Glycogen recognition site of AMP-activated protein kinase
MSVAQSSGQPDIFLPILNISINFIPDPPVQIQMKRAIKTSASSQHVKNLPSLFQVAAHLDGFAPANEKPQPQKLAPFDDLKLHSEKVEAVSKTKAHTIGQKSTKSTTRGAVRNTRENDNIGKPSCSLGKLIDVDFYLDAPLAKSVKLAADFTDWGNSPLDMVKSEDGVWHAIVPLPPGDHSYRFIVDGQWCDDPHPAMCAPNPFGTVNAIVAVT